MIIYIWSNTFLIIRETHSLRPRLPYSFPIIDGCASTSLTLPERTAHCGRRVRFSDTTPKNFHSPWGWCGDYRSKNVYNKNVLKPRRSDYNTLLTIPYDKRIENSTVIFFAIIHDLYMYILVYVDVKNSRAFFRFSVDVIVTSVCFSIALLYRLHHLYLPQKNV